MCIGDATTTLNPRINYIMVSRPSGTLPNIHKPYKSFPLVYLRHPPAGSVIPLITRPIAWRRRKATLAPSILPSHPVLNMSPKTTYEKVSLYEELYSSDQSSKHDDILDTTRDEARPKVLGVMLPCRMLILGVVLGAVLSTAIRAVADAAVQALEVDEGWAYSKRLMAANPGFIMNPETHEVKCGETWHDAKENGCKYDLMAARLLPSLECFFTSCTGS